MRMLEIWSSARSYTLITYVASVGGVEDALLLVIGLSEQMYHRHVTDTKYRRNVSH